MKTGLTLEALAAELERQRASKRDFVADTRRLTLDEQAEGLAVGGEKFGVTPYAHGQIAERLAIPVKFYERLRSAYPDLLAANVNRLLHAEPESRLVRVLDGNVRAMLSNRYRPLDNADLAEAVLPLLLEYPDLQVVSSQITETRLYIKVVFPRIQTEVKRGDVVQSGAVIANSEVGAGAIVVAPLVYTLACLNGMVAEQAGLRKNHAGRRLEGLDEAFELFSDATRQADDRAFFLKVRDIVRGTLREDVFERVVAGMRAATADEITGDVPTVVEVTAKRFSLGQETTQGVLRHLIKGGDLTRYGLMNAITRQSQDEPSYDEASRLERIGGQVIELPRGDWAVLSQGKAVKALAKAA